MAGLQHYRMAMDPGVQKMGTMAANRAQYFRFTPRTAGITFLYMVVVPTIIGVIAYKTDGKYNFRAKRKGDLIYEY
ncbi:NADH:ubiquinone oxidoreductase 6.6kD subunit [Xylaria intraflava]|nr:NADH:ubiquinone oxidoreductase 6.6kD subunit [Xylaria intraflava]